MAFFDNRPAGDPFIIGDKASDNYDIYSKNNRSVSGEKITPKSGFTRYKVTKNGKTEEKLIYTADFLSYDGNREKNKNLKVSFTCMFIIAVIDYVAAILVNAPLYSEIWVKIVSTISEIFMLYVLYTMVVKIKSPEKMTIYQGEVSSYRMSKGAIYAAIAMYVVLFFMVITALYQYDFGEKNMLAILLQFLSASLMLVMGIIEGKRKLVKIENRAGIPTGAVKIK
jgi:hypothetical protein